MPMRDREPTGSVLTRPVTLGFDGKVGCRSSNDALPDDFRCAACPLVERFGIAALGTKQETRTERR